MRTRVPNVIERDILLVKHTKNSNNNPLVAVEREDLRELPVEREDLRRLPVGRASSVVRSTFLPCLTSTCIVRRARSYFWFSYVRIFFQTRIRRAVTSKSVTFVIFSEVYIMISKSLPSPENRIKPLLKQTLSICLL